MNYELLKAQYDNLGLVFLTRPYEVNLFGVRKKDPIVNEFNCILGIAYIDGLGQKQCLAFKGSTLPGLYYLKNKLGNINGTAILQPGQYLDCWELSYHHIGKPNQYEAFRQRKLGVFKVWRDFDSDSQFDMIGTTYTDVTGLNGHHAADKESVGAYGAGCQIVQDKEEHQIWIAPARRHVELYSNSLNYTLFQAA